MKFGIVVFPGSNCDQDIIYALRDIIQQETIVLWHKDESLDDFNNDDWIILPGGFSYGDYLRGGAIARFSPIMKNIISFAQNGGNVFGICNGFQILCEAGLLQGTLLRNAGQKFICKNVLIKSEFNSSKLTSKIPLNKPLKIPISHAEGKYYVQEEIRLSLEHNNQILFRYCDEQGVVSDSSNPNGSIGNIAGICNESRNVFGMMPHPERAVDVKLGNTDGQFLFDSIISSATDKIMV